jgi:hypothetical protein
MRSFIMNSPDSPRKDIETEAEDHAEETRYAIEHHGREKHPEQKQDPEQQQSSDHRPAPPWQVD